MFCGFGAVVLLVLIINSNTIAVRQERVADLSNELRREETTNRLVRQHSEQLRLDSEVIRAALEALQKEQTELTGKINELREALALESPSENAEDQITRLQAELKILEKKARQLAEEKVIAEESGRQVRPFEGAGHRQYLTGLKLGGKRVLILIDSSASMLDRTIVNIVRRKVMDDAARRSAPKWQRALLTAEWIIANLPVDSSIQAYHFSENTSTLSTEEGSSWMAVTNSSRVDELLSNLRQIAPIGGTNLEEAFLKARSITPQPDNIILITDGLPTRRKAGNRARTIDAAGRAKLFDRAIRQLPAGVPVNVILFPIEGDPFAAVNYWKLAVDSGGSFLTPARDWP